MRVLLLFFLAFYGRSQAQDSILVVKAGKTLNESIAMADLYEYPQFVLGKVFFRSGDSTVARLNYHRLSDQMQFIDLKGDTLDIINAGNIKFIRINNDVFYFDIGYVKLIKDIEVIKLASKQTLRLSGKNKIGAYDMANPTSAIDSYGTLIDHQNIYRLVPREDIMLTKKMQYYFGDKYNHFVLASRKSLLREFSKHSGAINVYFKENDVDFNSRQDLEKLLQFLAGL